MSGHFDILVLTDLHFIEKALHTCPLPSRRGEFAALFVRKAVQRLRYAGVKPDLLVVLGDLVDNGLADGAADDLSTLAAVLRDTGIPHLVVPGNHDGNPECVQRVFGTAPGLHRVGDYGFLVFADTVAAGDLTTRPDEPLSLPRRAADGTPGLPLIALQHNPVHPPVDSRYPYLLTNAAAVMAGYERAGVVLSLSGHYHAGLGPVEQGGVAYFTAPALCESPFSFAHVRLDGRRVEIRQHALRLDAADLVDVHCHTEYAYCGTSVSAARCLAVSDALGVGGVCLTEHTFQLYFGKDDAWSFRWQTDRAMVERAWRARGGRMDAYRRFAAPLRGPRTWLGLEVDLCSDGRLLLAPEDRESWDVLVGAVHNIPGFQSRKTAQAEAEDLFMRDTARILAEGVTVLAHPFRFFRRGGLQTPRHLYPDVAALLARHGVAAEINYHVNETDPDFIAECVRRGVRLAVGSDSHDIVETGEFWPHLDVMRRAGLSGADLPHILFRPAGTKRTPG